ncbi:MAG: AtuA-related protein, partial [Pyrinomonadaceae bacterium]
MKIPLLKLAHARSGDKGDTTNVGIIALKEEYYPRLVREVTAEAVKEHFGAIVKGKVERFEL